MKKIFFMDFFSQYFEEKKIIVFWFDLLRKIEEIILSNDNLKVFFLSAKLSVLLCWCQIVLVPNCPVPNCPVPNCPTTLLTVNITVKLARLGLYTERVVFFNGPP